MYILDLWTQAWLEILLRGHIRRSSFTFKICAKGGLRKRKLKKSFSSENCIFWRKLSKFAWHSSPRRGGGGNSTRLNSTQLYCDIFAAQGAELLNTPNCKTRSAIKQRQIQWKKDRIQNTQHAVGLQTKIHSATYNLQSLQRLWLSVAWVLRSSQRSIYSTALPIEWQWWI